MGKGAYMSKRKMMLLRKQDCRWYLKEADKKRLVDKCMEIINDPDSTERAIGIAMKNYIMLNGQNIQTCEDSQSDTNVNITIKEE